jgi:plastocyanin
MTNVRMKRSALILLMVAAACSGETTPSSSSSSPSPTPSQTPCLARTHPITFPRCPVAEVSTVDLSAQGANVTLSLEAGEGAWGPTFIKTKPGAQVTVTVKGGADSHSFTIDSLSVNKVVPTNEDVVVSFTLPSTGPVIFYCVPHLSRGMQGAFYFS